MTLGPAYSLLRPKAYIAIFVTADAVCLVLQAIGGGLAAVRAKSGNNVQMPTRISKPTPFTRPTLTNPQCSPVSSSSSAQ